MESVKKSKNFTELKSFIYTLQPAPPRTQLLFFRLPAPVPKDNNTNKNDREQAVEQDVSTDQDDISVQVAEQLDKDKVLEERERLKLYPLYPGIRAGLDECTQKALAAAANGELLSRDHIVHVLEAARSGAVPVSEAPPTRPSANSLFVFDKTKAKYRQDGLLYSKESHYRIVWKDKDKLLNIYVGTTTDLAMRRRRCWDINDDSLVVVQYFLPRVPEDKEISSEVEEQRPSKQLKPSTVPLDIKQKLQVADKTSMMSMADALASLSSARVLAADVMQLATKYMFRKIALEEGVCLFNLIEGFAASDDIEMMNSLIANALITM